MWKKCLVIIVLVLGSFIPLGMVENLVRERAALRGAAEQDIASSWAGAQRLGGPVLWIPYQIEKTVEVTRLDGKGRTQKTMERKVEHRQALYQPEAVSISGTLDPAIRYRGIHAVRAYVADLAVTARFAGPWPVNATDFRGERVCFVGEAQAAFGLAHPRGIEGEPVLVWKTAAGETRIPLKPGVEPSRHQVTSGFHGLVPAAALTGPAECLLSLRARGTEALRFQPAGKVCAALLRSSWPHPKFIGGFLPRERSVTEQGFTADWSVTELAMSGEADAAKAWRDDLTSFGVELIEPVDIYQQSLRAAKHGILFVALTFVAFFLVEVLRGARVHPMQYAMVAGVLAVFYLLLVSLSEHLGFARSYLMASSACVLLLGYYGRFILRSGLRNGLKDGGGWLAGLCLALGLAALYGVLYLILLSEDNALALGSGLVFLVLAGAMVATRRVDWDAVSSRSTQPGQQSQAGQAGQAGQQSQAGQVDPPPLAPRG